MKIDFILKQKFSNNFDSVRKAFRILDSNHDGFISIEDFMRTFGGDSMPNVQDLRKLMIEKDSKRVGKLNYEDFSSWVGSSIH